MTVSYTGDVANGSSFGCFWKILHRWKGSVYKLIWRELLAYLFIYFIFNLIYRFGLDKPQRETFEKVKVYCSKQIESIPMSFVLGFYVSLIVKRWWEQYWLLPLPDNLALYISSSLHGQDERGRILRRTIMRYTVLAYIITLQRISFRVKKRFPTLQHLVDAGLMMESEKKIFDKFEEKTTVSKFWMPTVWASNLVNRARLEGRIQSDHMLQTIIMELSDFRRLLGRVMIYDTVSVPLVYTQVVTLAVYTYFIAALFGRQWVHPDDEGRRTSIYPGYELDLCFPIFLSLQFIFYVGWLKVAETLINPFGEDDDDFELNWLIDRHIQVSYMVVDEMHEEHPELLRDQYWEQVVPAELPYNHASGQFRRKEPQGSTASMKIKASESVYDNLPAGKRHSSVIPDEVYADLESVTESPLVDNRKTWIQRQLSRVESFRSNSSSSSLFGKNRAQHLQNNGGLPSVVKNSGQRMSIYDKLMNRRSSKEKSAPRVPSRALPNGNVGQMDTLMTPQARPRVPTPDVARETQISIATPGGDNIPISGKLPKNINLKAAPMSHSNVTPNVYSVSNTMTNGIPIGVKPIIQINNTNRLSSTPSPPPKTPPLNIDLSQEAHLMLSPIEEGDGSPYSTSSTNRSSKSSYPTTSSIFPRKPSPPPPKTELPPIPPPDGSTTSSKSTEASPKAAIRALDHAIESETTGGGDDEQSESDDPYQTISEVSDAKAEYARNISPQLRDYLHGGRRLSKEKQELMLKKLKSMTSVNKSSQASMTRGSSSDVGEDFAIDTGQRKISTSSDIREKTHFVSESSRIDSSDKCTNTEADFSNNNMTPKNDVANKAQGEGEDDPSIKCEVFV